YHSSFFNPQSTFRNPQSHKAAADLIDEQGAQVRQAGHVGKREPRVPPGPGLTLDSRQGRAALAAEREKYHDRQGYCWRVDRAAVGPALCLHRLAQFYATLFLVAAKVINGAERGNDDLACRKTGQGRHADLPVPAQRAHEGLDRAPGLSEKTLPQPGPGLFAVEAVYLFGRSPGAVGTKFLRDPVLVGVKRQRPDKEGGRKNNGPGPREDRQPAVVHAEQHDPPRRHLEGG